MLIKYPFNSVVFRKLNLYQFLCPYYSKPALILCSHNLGVRYAGHSKWQNIKKTKETNDLARCKAFNFYIGLMRKEAFKGSLDPKLNSKLASIIKQAQAINMPLVTINNVLKNFEKLKSNPHKLFLNYKSGRGIILMIEIATDHPARTRGELNTLLRKYGVQKAEDNVRTAFIIKGNVIAKLPENDTDPSEKAIDDAIEVGAEEVEPVEEAPEYLKFICEASDANIVKTKLESKNYCVESCEQIYLPRNAVELEEEEHEKFSELLVKLEEHPDVERVIDNIA